MDHLVYHLFPSLLFGLYGLLWLFQSFWLHLTTWYNGNVRRCHSKENLQQKSYIPLFCCPGLPLEPVLFKMVPSLVGLTFTAVGGYHAMQTSHIPLWSLPMVLVHMTMYGVLLVAGMVDILALCIPFPKQTPQVFLTTAFLAIGFVTYFLFEVQSTLEDTMRLLFMLAIAAVAVFSSLRVILADSIWINTGFALSLILLATQFLQVWFVLHGPNKWDPSEDSNETFAKNCFVWQVVIIIMCSMLVYALLSIVGKRRGKSGIVLHSEAERDKLLLKEEVILNEEIVTNNNNSEHVD